jgi:hypothetical protein
MSLAPPATAGVAADLGENWISLQQGDKDNGGSLIAGSQGPAARGQLGKVGRQER